MLCAKCGNNIPDSSASCPICGAVQNTSANSAAPTISPKSRLVALLLALFLGLFGAHNFYTEHTGRAISQLVITLLSIPLMFVLVGFFTLGAVAIWGFIEIILILAGGYKDAKGGLIINW